MSFEYFMKRFQYTLFVFLFVITLNFFLFRLIPGDPLAMLSKELVSDPEVRATIEQAYGLDKPLYIQFVNYLKSMVTFDFGTSFQYRQPVWPILKEKIRNSMVLGVSSVPIGIAMGLFGGILAGSRRGKRLDLVLTSSTMLLYAVPTFWLGMIFLMIFGVRLGWVPFNGMVTAGARFPSTWAYVKDVMWHLAVPVASYALAIFGGYFMIMRGAMVDVYGEDYVLTARAKGLTERQVRNRHVVPNAMLPSINMIIMSLAFMFTGTFSIEVLFTWPGMGRLMVDSVTRRDYPVLQASNYLVALVVVAASFLLDILYTYIDPRVKLE